MTDVTRLPTLVSLHRVCFQFAHGQTLFDDLSLTLDSRPTALVGRNGAGKSLLTRLIAGQLTPSGGAISRFAAVAYVPQLPAQARGQSVAQLMGVADVLHALARMAAGQANPEDLERIDDRWDLAQRVRAGLDAAGLEQISPEQRADGLSGGQLARIGLLGAFLGNTALLILDEPSNHLDRAGRAWLLQMMAQWRGGLLVISHDRQLLRQVQRIVELTPRGLRNYGGDYALFQAQREAQHTAAQAALVHARDERSRERKRQQRKHDTIQRRAAASRKNADTANISRPERAGMKGAAKDIMGHVRHAHQARQSDLDAQVRQAYSQVIERPSTLFTLPGSAVPAARQVFTLVDAQLPWLAPNEPGSRLTCTVHGPVRIAVNGPNGCGKSTLLKMLAGVLAPIGGRCTTHVPHAYLDQALALLDDQRSILEQLGPQTTLDEGELRTRLALLQLDAARVVQPCAHLSGGERLKAALALALWRRTPAQLLLLDEPTNHLDLESLEAIEQALATCPAAMVVVSHDEDFIAALAPTHHLTWQTSGWHLRAADHGG